MEGNCSVNPLVHSKPRGLILISCSIIFHSWIKFEEDVEDGGNRWTKPFVGTLSLHALFELRSSLLNGTLVLDADASSVMEVIDVVTDGLASTYRLSDEQKNRVSWILF